MKIELKKISVNERMSQETTMFIADLYIDGRKVGYCRNEGCGGCTDYHGDTSSTFGYTNINNELIAKAEAYCKTLPDVKFGDMTWKQSLEGVIDELVEEHLKAKEQKKIQKLYTTAIVFGMPNGCSYRYLNFKRPLTELPIVALKAHVAKIINTSLKKGEQILNTNFKIEDGEIIFLK